MRQAGQALQAGHSTLHVAAPLPTLLKLCTLRPTRAALRIHTRTWQLARNSIMLRRSGSAGSGSPRSSRLEKGGAEAGRRIREPARASPAGGAANSKAYGSGHDCRLVHSTTPAGRHSAANQQTLLPPVPFTCAGSSTQSTCARHPGK